MLKRHNRYISIKAERLYFKDLILFTCPMSLDKYLKTWGCNNHKLCFPYSLFQSIEEMRNCKVFPAIDKFKEDKDVEIDVYEECKALFEKRMSLPEGHVDKWYNFGDYLKHYNLSDVIPTAKALQNQFELFEDEFELCSYQCMGLPQFGRKAMYKMYDPKAPAIFTFNEGSTATKVFRNQIVGGLVNLYKRHVTLDESEDVPAAARYNKNGMF